MFFIGGMTMPELPEVEIVRQGLESLLTDNTKILKIECLRANLREEFPLKDFKKLCGAKIIKIERRAKYLIFVTDKGSLLSHLGMTGTWRIVLKDQELKHDHVYIHLNDGRRLAYRDPRRFGYLGFIPLNKSHVKFASLGPEPLSEDFNEIQLLKALINKKAAIKSLIMDQRIVVGVGNIYASEALFAAKINPFQSGQDLEKKAAIKLVKEIKKVLKKSIDKGGSTISDFASAKGDKGYFQNSFKVYGRQGELCMLCSKNLIKKALILGRSSFWCPGCQK